MSDPVPSEVFLRFEESLPGPRPGRRRSVLEKLERKPQRGSKKRLGGSFTVSMIVHAGILVVLGLITHIVGLPSMIAINSAIEGPDDSALHSPELLVLGDLSESTPNPTESEVSLLPKIAAPTPAELLTGQAASGSLTSGGGGGGAGGTGQGGFFGVPLNENSIVFVLDRSGSMRGDRLSRVQYELRSAINGLGDDQKFNVLMYNSDVAHALPSSRTDLLPASNANRRKAVDAAMKYSASGGTNGVLAIQEALKLRPEAIVFLTDGEFDINVEEDVFDENKQGATIHTVSIGDGTSLDVLKKIASGSRGRFQHVFVKKHQQQNNTASVRKSRDADRLLRVALGLVSRRKLDKAREYCQKIIKDYPKYNEALRAKEILKEIGETKDALLLRRLGAK
jgi:hypothetical protein